MSEAAMTDLAAEKQEWLEKLVTNKPGHREVMQAIQARLDAMDDGVKVHFLQEVYDNVFVYEVKTRDGGGSSLYRRGYSVKSSGEVEFSEEPATPVRKEVKFVPINNNNSEQGGVILSEKKTPCCPEKVQLLIASEHTPYQETDKEFLESLDEARVDQLVSLAEAATPVERDEDEGQALQINVEDAVAVLKEKGINFLSLLPEEEQETIAASKALLRQTRARLIEGIVTNSDYTKEELATWKVPALEKLSKALKVEQKPSFAGLNAGGGNSRPEIEPLMPVFAEERKEGGAS